MKRLVLILAATALSTSPAAAQMTMHMPGMHMPGMNMPAPKPTPAKKKPATKKSSGHAGAKKAASQKGVARQKASRKAPANKQLAHPHHDTSSMPGMGQPSSGGAAAMPGMPAGHEMSTHDMSTHDMSASPSSSGQPMENMPGMTTPTGEHAGHDMSGMAAPAPPLAPPPAAALQGPENAADTVYGAAAMQPSRTFLLHQEHGGMVSARLLINELEHRVRKGRDGYFLNAEGWYGGDINKLWVKSEVEGSYGRKADQVEVQALWSHAIGPWFNLQTGVRLDAEPKTRGRFVLGVEGLAPYWWEVSGALFLSTKGEVTARAEASHDVRITQKLILQPRAQVDLALQDIPEERVGAGLSTVEAGLRLRYQITPTFSPYVGLVYERSLGSTERYTRADGESPGGLQFTVGLRTWF